LNLRRHQLLLDIGSGSGHYSIALLKRNPELNVIMLDRPCVIDVASTCVARARMRKRCQMIAADMFSDPFPAGMDAMLLSNILHDWDVTDCRKLIARCSAALPSGGRLFVHDTFLNDDLSGSLSAALHSASIFMITEGRLYSRSEISHWLSSAGLKVEQRLVPTAYNYAVLTATKP